MKIQPRITLRILLFIASLFALSGCGGSNTSSGGSTSANVSGSFNGRFGITVNAVGTPGAVATTAGTATAEITNTNRITLTLSNGVQLLGSINSTGAFRVQGNAAQVVTDATCSAGVLTVAGQFDGENTISATLSSSGLVCDGLAAMLTGRITLQRI